MIWGQELPNIIIGNKYQLYINMNVIKLDVPKYFLNFKSSNNLNLNFIVQTSPSKLISSIAQKSSPKNE